MRKDFFNKLSLEINSTFTLQHELIGVSFSGVGGVDYDFLQ